MLLVNKNSKCRFPLLSKSRGVLWHFHKLKWREAKSIPHFLKICGRTTSLSWKTYLNIKSLKYLPWVWRLFPTRKWPRSPPHYHACFPPYYEDLAMYQRTKFRKRGGGVMFYLKRNQHIPATTVQPYWEPGELQGIVELPNSGYFFSPMSKC